MKPTDLTTYLVIAAVALAFLLIWAGSIALVSWDARRRKLSRLQRWLGVALSVTLPLVGAMAYWMVLLISWGMRPTPQVSESPKHRITQPMPAPRTPEARNTISAAEMGQPTIPFHVPEPASRARPTANPRAYQMSVAEGPNAGAEFHMNRFPAVIGRSSTAFVLLDKDPKVSRQHAEIYEAPEALHLRDLGSLHGTLVNGSLVQDHTLRAGDRIQAGDSVLVFQIKEG